MASRLKRTKSKRMSLYFVVWGETATHYRLVQLIVCLLMSSQVYSALAVEANII